MFSPFFLVFDLPPLRTPNYTGFLILVAALLRGFLLMAALLGPFVLTTAGSKRGGFLASNRSFLAELLCWLTIGFDAIMLLCTLLKEAIGIKSPRKGKGVKGACLRQGEKKAVVALRIVLVNIEIIIN